MKFFEWQLVRCRACCKFKTMGLITHDHNISATLSRCRCKVLSPQLCKIFRMASKSAKSVFDFLRLTRSWLRIVAASGINFSKTVAVGAEFCFSSESSASISSRWSSKSKYSTCYPIYMPSVLISYSRC